MDDQDCYADKLIDDSHVGADQREGFSEQLYVDTPNTMAQRCATKKGSAAVVPAGSRNGVHLPLQHLPLQQQQSSEGAGHSAGFSTEDAGELPSLHSRLGHSELPLRKTKAAGTERAMQHPSAADPPNLAAALGGVLALTGSLLSYTIARVKGSRRARSLQQGLAVKEQALAAAQQELGRAKKQLSVLKEAADKRRGLEAELAESRSILEVMTSELEAARAASCMAECDMAAFQDQLHSLSSSKQQASQAMAAAEQCVAQADKQRQHAEARWQKACRDQEAAQEELETIKGELGLRGSQLEALTRELEFTGRQLADAEKRVERAHMESRSARSGYEAEDYGKWD